MNQADLLGIRQQNRGQTSLDASNDLGIKLGDKWRLVEGPYPYASSATCVLIQYRTGTAWTTVDAFMPDGTDARRCYAIYKTATAQSIPNNTATVVNFDTLEADTDSAVTVGTTWNFKCPINKGGLYWMAAQVAVTFGAGGSTNFWIQARKNGTAFEEFLVHPVGANSDNFIHVASLIVLAAGDTLDAAVLQDSGGALPLDTSAISNRVVIMRIPFN